MCLENRKFLFLREVCDKHLSEFFLLVDESSAAGDHLVQGVQPVLQPLDGLHVLIIEIGNSLTAFCYKGSDDPWIKLNDKETRANEIFSQ